MRPRALWSAEVAATYGIKPWEMHRLTPAEWEDVCQHHEAAVREAEGYGA